MAKYLRQRVLSFVKMSRPTGMFLEHKFIYHPKRDGPWDLDVGFPKEDIFFLTEDKIRLHGWFIPREGDLGTILWMHGNAGNITYRLEMIRRLIELPVSIFIFDYRGYGKSKGRPREKGIYRDARAAYEYLRGRGIPAEKIVLFGKSLGGAPAIVLATEVKVAALILQSTFTCAKDMVKRIFGWFPAWFWVDSRFHNLQRIPHVRVPTLIIHGQRDRVIPFWMAEKLYNAAHEPKELYAVPEGGHNFLYWGPGRKYMTKLRQFLEGVLVPAR